jgi:hypothetical protein
VNLGKLRVPLIVYRPPSSSPGPTMRSIDRKPSNMGIAELKPRQLAPTVGTTGSGSTGSPAPSSSSTMSRLHAADHLLQRVIGTSTTVRSSRSSLARQLTVVRSHLQSHQFRRVFIAIFITAEAKKTRQSRQRLGWI